MATSRQLSRLYGTAGELFLGGQLSWLEGEFKVALFDARYVPDFELHVTLIAVPEVARTVGLPLINRTRTKGRAYASPVNFTDIVHPEPITGFVVWKEPELLICASTEASGLPYELNPLGERWLLWDAVTGGVFAL